MKAATYQTYGDPSVVEVREINKPVPADNEVLVKVHATIVTAGDARMRAFDIPAAFRLPGRFMLGWPTPKKPVLGYAYSGIVEAVGRNVTAFVPGDQVLGGRVGGAHAEYNCVPASGPMSTVILRSASWSSELARASDSQLITQTPTALASFVQGSRIRRR